MATVARTARAAIAGFCSLAFKPKAILRSLAHVAVEGAVQCIPGVGAARELLAELAAHGEARLSDPAADVPGVKPAGQVFSDGDLNDLNRWLEVITTQTAGIASKLDRLVAMREGDPFDSVLEKVQAAMTSEEIAAEFASVQKVLRWQTLSLGRIEEKIDEHRAAMRVHLGSLEDIKAILTDLPTRDDWRKCRSLSPELASKVSAADACFAAGRRDEGVQMLMGLMRGRYGVGTATVARQLGGIFVAQGKPDEARRAWEQAGNAGPSPAVTNCLSRLSTSSDRADARPWRSLPRGFVVEGKYRVEAEVGRGGMGSVYRVVGCDFVTEGEVYALKVPNPALMVGDAARRFEQEVKTGLRLSKKEPNRIVLTRGYVRVNDPHTGQDLYGMVMDFIDGRSLAQEIAYRRGQKKTFAFEEVATILRDVAEALAFAHEQTPAVVHCDVKPHNVMLGVGGRAKLMDFGIARVLNDSSVLTGSMHQLGSAAYVAPEISAGRSPDVRSDVYSLGVLMLEMITGSCSSDISDCDNCPKEWIDLYEEATAHSRKRRPESTRAFLDRLEKLPIPVAEKPVRDPLHDLTHRPDAISPPIAPSSLPITSESDARPLMLARPPKKIVVDCNGDGDCMTISQAIIRAGIGTHIIIRPGRYNENVIVSKDVKIMGEGSRTEIILESCTGSPLTMATDGGSIEKITIRRLAQPSQRYEAAIVVAHGRPVIQDCSISSNAFACVLVKGQASNPTVRRCEITNELGVGVYIFGDGSGQIADCPRLSGGLAGVLIAGASTVNILNCKISGCNTAGLYAKRCKSLRIERCSIFLNGKVGIMIADDAHATVADCAFRENRGVGVFVSSEGSCGLQGCTLVANIGVGIAAFRSRLFRAAKSVVKEGKSEGVVIDGCDCSMIEDVEISENLKSGLAVSGAGEATIRNAIVRNNGASGISLADGANALIESSQVVSNARSNIEIRGGATARIKECNINKSMSLGIRAFANARGSILNSHIEGNSNFGISISDGSNLTILDCVINNNDSEGVRAHTNAVAIVERCELIGNGDAGAFFIAPDSRVVRKNNKE